MSDIDLFKTKFAHYNYPDHFGELLGYKVTYVSFDAREAHVSMPVEERHLSMARRIHGGAISALLDFTCGMAVVTTLGENDLCSTVELKVNYFHPVNQGSRLVAKANVIFRGKKLCAVNGFLYKDDEEEPVAMASATYNVVSR